MDWLKPLLPLLQTGLKLYASGQVVKKSADHAKDVAVRSSVVAFGALAFLVFLTASIIMVFVDLGHQFDSGRDLTFSGMMLSSLYLTGFGAILLGISVGVSKLLSSREKKEAEKTPEPNPYAPLILFGEEFLKQLIENLNQKNETARSAATRNSSPADPAPRN